MTQSEDVPEAIQCINDFCKKNTISINNLSKLAKVEQAGLHRFLANERKTVTSIARQVLSYIDNYHNKSYVKNEQKELGKYTANEIIKESVQKLCDVDPASLDALSEFIEATQPLFQVFLKHRQK